MSNINVKTLEVSREQFFIYWLQFLKPYHKLRDKEIEMLAHFLVKRDELSEKIKDDNLLDTMLFDKDIKHEIREKMNYSSPQVFNNMISSLRKKKIIVRNKINRGLIPTLKPNDSNFKLIFNFNIKDEVRQKAKADNQQVSEEV